MKTSSEAGSHVLAFALAILAVALIGFAGYRVWTMQRAASTQSNATTTATVPAKITNKATLDRAASVLDQSSAELNATLDGSSLTADVNALL